MVGGQPLAGAMSFALRVVLAMAASIPATSAHASDEPAVPGAAGLVKRAPVIKPEHTRFDDQRHHARRISVQFQDGSTIRVRQGHLTDLGTGALDPAKDVLDQVAGGTWMRVSPFSEDKLEELRQTAQRNLGREIVDLNLHFHLIVPEGVAVGEIIDAFNELDVVEIALPVPLPVPAPIPPDFEGDQGYLNAADEGIDVACTRQLPGGTGMGISLADLEYDWNLDHQDLAPATLLGGVPNDPFNDLDHGTAVLGELGGLDNGFGVTGICPDAAYFVVATNTGPGLGVWDVGAAIFNALTALDAGDIILIEQQISGPNQCSAGTEPCCGSGNTQCGLIPVEWYQPWYAAIQIAVGNGVVVVEAAGNGEQDLDDPVYSIDNGGHYPFLPGNDSGAIIVGAGAAPSTAGGSDVARSRLSFSNYGSTVDLQGWGENIYTTGYGDAYNAEGTNLQYTSDFAGTSAASAIVAGAAALLQSVHKAHSGGALSPADVLSTLQSTGSAQQAGTFPITQHIGPFPDVASAISSALPALDVNSNDVPDVCESLGGCLIDQHQGDVGSAVGDPGGLGQTITAAVDGHLCSIAIYPQHFFVNPVGIEVDLRPATVVDGPDPSPASAWFSTAIPVNNIDPAGAWIEIDVSSADIHVCAGDVFAITTHPLAGGSQVLRQSFALNSYVDGNPWLLPAGGGSWQPLGGVERDFAFRVSSAPTDCPADFNRDGFVNAADLAQLLGNWGPNPVCPYDLNGSGGIDAADLAQLLGNWGPCP